MYSVHLHKLSDSLPPPEPVRLLSPVPQRQPVQPEPELLPVRRPLPGTEQLITVISVMQDNSACLLPDVQE